MLVGAGYHEAGARCAAYSRPQASAYPGEEEEYEEKVLVGPPAHPEISSVILGSEHLFNDVHDDDMGWISADDLYCIEIDKRKLQQVTYYSETKHRLITTTVFEAFKDTPITYVQLDRLLRKYYQIPSEVYGTDLTSRDSPMPDT